MQLRLQREPWKRVRAKGSPTCQAPSARGRVSLSLFNLHHGPVTGLAHLPFLPFTSPCPLALPWRENTLMRFLSSIRF